MRAVRLKAWVLGAALVLAATLGPIAMGRFLPFLNAFETWVADYRIATLRPPAPQHPDIVFVALTEETLARFPYRSPVDRAFLAGLLGTLEQRDIRALFLDVLLDSPTEPDKDAALKRVLAGLTVPTVVSYGDEAEGLTPKQAAFLRDYVPAPLRAAANLNKDPYDGTVRLLFPAKRLADGTLLPAVAPALLAKLGRPVVPPEDLPIAWRGQPDARTPPFRQFPAHAVPLLPAAWFKDKIVIVGADLTDTDRHATPFRAAFPGLEGSIPGALVHAHALAQLLDGQDPPAQGPGVLLAATLLAALAGLLLGRLEVGVWLRLLIGLTVIAGIWVAAFALFRYQDVMAPVIAPSLALAMASWMADLYSRRQEREQKKFIQAAFSKYLSPVLLDDILKDPSKLQLDPKRRELSYIFTDVAGFTTISESMDALSLADVMNRYLDGMVTIVFRHGGTVDKFIGDAVFALFNAPRDQEDHARRAALCALELDAFAQSFLQAEQAAGRAFGITRIGVHTGPASVGNFGAEARFEYTALGDSVNTAARLEGLNKYFGTRIALSGATLARAGELAHRPIGQIVLKGKTEPIPVHEPLTAGQADSGFVQRYRLAYDAMAAGETQALALFERLAQDRPEDGPTRLHLDRLYRGELGDRVIMAEK
ncbi:adenylate/guanylate cyclase domain-containing protein [Oleisolibacter albus]|uniref:adenylate/guanylate cyclase domain-containing protein n=1 Tax=Oleisolibacter albus TaxID=2171757 RepID=UPI00138FEFFB|nr:adenylate/guanylate cyclase domain-containing protein [Oleisolibacter albus]